MAQSPFLNFLAFQDSPFFLICLFVFLMNYHSKIASLDIYRWRAFFIQNLQCKGIPNSSLELISLHFHTEGKLYINELTNTYYLKNQQHKHHTGDSPLILRVVLLFPYPKCVLRNLDQPENKHIYNHFSFLFHVSYLT